MAKLYECARCGVPFARAKMLKSRHTKLYYCIDFDECGRRHRNELTNEEIELVGEQLLKDLKGGKHGDRQARV